MTSPSKRRGSHPRLSRTLLFGKPVHSSPIVPLRAALVCPFAGIRLSDGGACHQCDPQCGDCRYAA
jgi:hypothetical protein